MGPLEARILRLGAKADLLLFLFDWPSSPLAHWPTVPKPGDPCSQSQAPNSTKQTMRYFLIPVPILVIFFTKIIIPPSLICNKTSMVRNSRSSLCSKSVQWNISDNPTHVKWGLRILGLSISSYPRQTPTFLEQLGPKSIRFGMTGLHMRHDLKCVTHVISWNKANQMTTSRH